MEFVEPRILGNVQSILNSALGALLAGKRNLSALAPDDAAVLCASWSDGARGILAGGRGDRSGRNDAEGDDLGGSDSRPGCG